MATGDVDYWSIPMSDMDDATLLRALKDPRWRLFNIYFIRDKEGKIVPFRPWDEQIKFLDNIWFRNVVPKARQRGFSTIVQLLMFDACVFSPNIAAGIIAQDLDTAKKISRDKIDTAWEHLPDVVRKANPLVVDNKQEKEWANGSTMSISTSTRGNTLQYLHVSELGKTAKTAPERAKEIQEGSLPSVDKTGVIVVESTVESPDDIFSRMVKQAQKVQQLGRPLSKLEYRLHFASWWDADEYEEDPQFAVITPKDNAYFERIEAEIGRPISARKRAWYVLKRDNELGGDDEKMWSQYPSTLEEALKGSTEGRWLARPMAQARSSGRVMQLPIYGDRPVDTWWDIGRGDDVAIWFSQEDGPWTNWMDFYEISDAPYNIIVGALNAKGYLWGRHYLPHDGDHRQYGTEALKTSRDMLEELGLRRIEIVPRIPNLLDGINQLRQAFPAYRFDEQRTKAGLDHLDNYAKSWSPTLGQYIDVPLKNGHQHAADAIRQHAQMQHLRVEHGGGRAPRRRNRSGMAV
jgi:hypothetical protein